MAARGPGTAVHALEVGLSQSRAVAEAGFLAEIQDYNRAKRKGDRFDCDRFDCDRFDWVHRLGRVIRCHRPAMALDLIPVKLRSRYETHEWRHAAAILHHEFPSEFNDIVAVLGEFKLCKSFIDNPGGRKSQISEFIDTRLYKRGWTEKCFDTKTLVDGKAFESPTHSVDCFKNRVALEIEWNNKDPFFDRDLNNFRLLFDLRVVSVGVIITRCDELQNLFKACGRGSSYGASTTHIGKLLPRIEGGGGGGCPILALGIRSATFTEDC